MIAALVVVVGAVTWLVWPSSDDEPRARQYKETAACLLTDDKGLNDAQAAAVWSGMQKASEQTLVRVQYLTVTGPQTRENAETFLGTFTQSKCTVILAVGTAPTQAVPQVAPRFPGIKFVTVGGGGNSGGGSNVSTVTGDATALQQGGHDAVVAASTQS